MGKQATPVDMINSLKYYSSELDKVMTQYEESMEEFLKFKEQYEIEFSKEYIKRRAEGEKVTGLKDVIKGLEYVCSLGIRRDGAEERMKLYKMKIQTFNAKLSMGQTILNYFIKSEFGAYKTEY